jgi:hypothetical protein
MAAAWRFLPRKSHGFMEMHLTPRNALRYNRRDILQPVIPVENGAQG